MTSLSVPCSVEIMSDLASKGARSETPSLQTISTSKVSAKIQRITNFYKRPKTAIMKNHR